MWVGSSEGGETEDIAKVGKESYENKHTPRSGAGEHFKGEGTLSKRQ